MEQSWRWFGDDDPIPLDHIAQAGATGIVTALHHIPVGQRWTADEIARRKLRIEASGLIWSVCESIMIPEAIKLGGKHAVASLDAWKDSLAALGRAGVPVVCYNFMPAVDWTRTDLAYRTRSGGLALRFDLIDFIGYDVFVLKRADAVDDYEPALIDDADRRIAAKSEVEVARLEHNIFAGLPGGAERHTRASIAELIARYRGMSDEAMRDNLVAFLREVVPIAEEVGVRLANHPDDPPRSLFGLPRVVSTAADARRILAGVDSDANGLTLCAGSYGSRGDNDVVAMAREFAPRIHFAHLRNVTIEPDGSFREAEHLEGGIDMVSLIDVLLREERAARREGRRADIAMRPDHGHLLADDVGKRSNPGYSCAGRLKGLAELRGVMRALEKSM